MCITRISLKVRPYTIKHRNIFTIFCPKTEKEKGRKEHSKLYIFVEMVTPSSDYRAIINLLDISKAKILLVIERINHCLQDQHFGGKFPIAMKMSA